MISQRTEVKKLRLSLALVCSFTTSTHAVAQAKAAPRFAGHRPCEPCCMKIEMTAGASSSSGRM